MLRVCKWTVALTLAAACISPVALGAPYPTSDTPRAIDLGAQGNAPVTVTVALKLRDTDGMMSLMQALYSKDTPQFHQFISPAQFHERFAPLDSTVQTLINYFIVAGLKVSRLTGNLLSVTGQQAAIEKAFHVSLHTFEIPAHGTISAYRYRAPIGEPKLEPSLAGNVQGVFGLDNRPRFQPHIKHALANLNHAGTSIANAPKTQNQPGLWTVADFAQYYNVQPLYNKDILGQHQTIGIVTLAAFKPSDAFTYWNSLNLKTDPHRITVVNIDGGPGAPSDASGSDETTLDVEQSGGIAPAAKIIVYQAPNTSQGFVDAFAKAIDNNQADTIATSWGLWELFASQTDLNNPNTGHSENELWVYNDLFVQAALQGQSLFAASGDDGAYDANDSQIFPLPRFSKVLSVDHPADEPYITAVGGTTLPGSQIYNFSDGSKVTVNIRHEQTWGWKYLTGVCTKLGLPDPVSCGTFPIGSGGGVSVFFSTPIYQLSISGIKASQSGQSLVDTYSTPPQTLATLPDKYRGRNVPDISFNADPNTGYILAYTSDKNGFSIVTYLGGTSFSTQQLNGVTTLLNQSAHGRMGLLNIELYNLVRSNSAYNGHYPPLRDIYNGNNWFYMSHSGYDQGSGVGVIDVANFAGIL